jgi:hypothetical protein
MIDVHCPACGRVLLGSGQMVGLTKREAGFEVAYVCWCGRPGVELVRRAGNERRRAGVGG